LILLKLMSGVKVPTDVTMDEDCSRLITYATATITKYFHPGRHHVACALLGEKGKIYDGIHLDCDGYDTCAEPVAIAQATLAYEKKMILIVAVMKSPHTDRTEVINPCGNCLQHLGNFAPNIDVVTQTPSGLKRLPLQQLMPYPYNPTS